jgi:hypothetical protein
VRRIIVCPHSRPHLTFRQAGAFLTFYGMSLGMVAYRAISLALVMLFSGEGGVFVSFSLTYRLLSQPLPIFAPAAGTFLFVATVHILPELTHGSPMSWGDVGLVVVGLLLPIVLNMEHGH